MFLCSFFKLVTLSSWHLWQGSLWNALEPQRSLWKLGRTLDAGACCSRPLIFFLSCQVGNARHMNVPKCHMNFDSEDFCAGFVQHKWKSSGWKPTSTYCTSFSRSHFILVTAGVWFVYLFSRLPKQPGTNLESTWWVQGWHVGLLRQYIAANGDPKATSGTGAFPSHRNIEDIAGFCIGFRSCLLVYYGIFIIGSSQQIIIYDSKFIQFYTNLSMHMFKTESSVNYRSGDPQVLRLGAFGPKILGRVVHLGEEFQPWWS